MKINVQAVLRKAGLFIFFVLFSFSSFAVLTPLYWMPASNPTNIPTITDLNWATIANWSTASGSYVAATNAANENNIAIFSSSDNHNCTMNYNFGIVNTTPSRFVGSLDMQSTYTGTVTQVGQDFLIGSGFAIGGIASGVGTYANFNGGTFVASGSNRLFIMTENTTVSTNGTLTCGTTNVGRIGGNFSLQAGGTLNITAGLEMDRWPYASNFNTTFAVSGGTFNCGAGSTFMFYKNMVGNGFNDAISGNFSVVNLGFWQRSSNLFANQILVNGTINASGTLSILGTSSANFPLIIGGTGTVNVTGNVSINGGGTSTSLTILSPLTINVGGNITATGAFANPPTSGGTGTIVMNGSAGQTITNTSTSAISYGTWAFPNLTINNSSGKVTLSNNIPIEQNLTITTGTLDLGTNTCNRTSLGGTFSLSTNTTLLAGGSTGGVSNTSNFPNSFNTNTLLGTVNFDGNGAQNIPFMSYYNLIASTLSGSSTKTVVLGITINNDLTISSSTTLDVNTNSCDLIINGNFSNSGTFTQGTRKVTFGSSGTTKTIGGSTTTTFYNLTVNLTSITDKLSLNQNVVVSNLLTMTQGIFSTGTYSLTGAGGIALNAGDLQIGTLGVTVPQLSGTFTPISGTLTLNGDGNQTLASLNTYKHLVFTSTIAATKTLGGNIGLGGNLTISGPTTLDVGANYGITFNIGGANFVNNSTAATTFNAQNGTVTFNNGGLTTISGTAITTFFNVIITQTLVGHATNMNVAGDWTNNGGFTHNSGTVTLINTTSQLINGTAITGFNNLTKTGTGTTTLGVTTRIATMVNISAGTFDTQTFSLQTTGSGSLTMSGGILRIATAGVQAPELSTPFTITGGLINFDAVGAQTIKGATYNNVSVNGTSGTGTKTLVGSIILLGNLNISSNATSILDVGAVGNYTVTLAGNWTNNGTFTPQNGLANFNGSTNTQTITGATTFNNLTFSNTFGSSPQITLTNNVTVNKILTFTNAPVVNLNSQTLTLGTAVGAATKGTLVHTGTSANGWMYGGTLTRWYVTSAVTIPGTNTAPPVTGLFPIGSSADFCPLWLGSSVDLSIGGFVSASFTPYSGAPTVLVPTDLTPPIGITDATWSGGNTYSEVTNSYWTVLSGGGFKPNGNTVAMRYGGGTTTFSRNANPNSVLGNTLTDLAAETAMLSTDPLYGTFAATTNALVTYEVNRTGVSSVGVNQNWRLATSNDVQSPMPVTWLSFEPILRKDNLVDVTWSTATETNNNYFSVLRSQDGITFSEVHRTFAPGNSIITQNYLFTDELPGKGLWYYQIKQVDKNGKSSSTEIKSVFLKSTPSIKFYPNPAIDELTIENIPADWKNIKIQIMDVTGKTIREINPGTIQTTSLQLFISDLPRSSYILKVSDSSSGTTLTTNSFIKSQ